MGARGTIGLDLGIASEHTARVLDETGRTMAQRRAIPTAEDRSDLPLRKGPTTGAVSSPQRRLWLPLAGRWIPRCSCPPCHPCTIGGAPQCSRRCCRTEWRQGGHRARHDRKRNVTLIGSDRAVRIIHTCALKCRTSPCVPAQVELRPIGNRGTREVPERALSPPDRLQHRDSLMPCGRYNESTQLHSRMRRAGKHRPGHRHGPEPHEGRG